MNQKLVESLPAEVVQNIFTISPSSDEASGAYARLVKLIGVANPDPYTTQVYDQVNLILMAIAAAKDSSGTAIRDTLRKVSQAPAAPRSTMPSTA